jgi:hypothetical protein
MMIDVCCPELGIRMAMVDIVPLLRSFQEGIQR